MGDDEKQADHELSPVQDLLEYCGNLTHELSVGRSLAPTLLGKEIGDSNDYDFELIQAMEDLLWDELAHLRGDSPSRKPRIPDPANAERRLKEDAEKEHPTLDALSLIWVFYMDRLKPKQIGAIVRKAPRTIYERIHNALLEVELLVARKAREQAGQHAGGVDVSANTGSNQAFDARPSQSALRRLTKPNRELDRLQRVVIVLLMIVWAWLTIEAAWVSISILLVVSGWRTAIYARRAVDARHKSLDEETTWQLYAMSAWLAPLAAAAFILAGIPTVLAGDLYSGVRLGLVLQALCIGAGVLLLGLMDFLFWIHLYAPPWGPWRPLALHAKYAVEHRWEAVTLGWGALALLGVALLLTSVF